MMILADINQAGCFQQPLADSSNSWAIRVWTNLHGMANRSNYLLLGYGSWSSAGTTFANEKYTVERADDGSSWRPHIGIVVAGAQ
jgi:hypothetical protein